MIVDVFVAHSSICFVVLRLRSLLSNGCVRGSFVYLFCCVASSESVV